MFFSIISANSKKLGHDSKDHEEPLHQNPEAKNLLLLSFYTAINNSCGDLATPLVDGQPGVELGLQNDLLS